MRVFRRSPASKEPRRRRGGYLVPNLLTTGNLFSGLFAVLSIFEGNFLAAAIAILVALVFDILDGKSARWMNSTSQFGVEYDSLADVVSFGVAPGLLVYAWALSSHGMAGAAVMFTFVACGALRLARFNVATAATESKYFTGLPIPAAASVLATLVIFGQHVVLLESGSRALLTLLLTLALAFLMVSTVKYRSFKDLKFAHGRHFNYLVWAILTIMLVAAWPQGMLFLAMLAYAVSGPIENAVSWGARPFAKRSATGPDQVMPETKE